MPKHGALKQIREPSKVRKGTKLPSAGTDNRGKLGMVAAIERLRTAERHAARVYGESCKTNDAELIARSRRGWTDLCESLRRLEVSTPEVGEANKSLVEISEVAQQFSRAVMAFRVALEAIPRSLPPRLAGQNEVTIHEVLKKAVNDVLGNLHAGTWAKK